MTTTGLRETLERLRSNGWSVAVHNDYRLNGLPHTFWLFTHPNGRWIKGEGETDEAALKIALSASTAEEVPNDHDKAIAQLYGDEITDRFKLDDWRIAICVIVEQAISHARRDAVPAPSLPEAKPVVSVKTMKLSDGREDYYVSVAVGDREITPSMHRIKGRSEYEVAEWNWLFNGGEKPSMLDWLDRTADPDEPATRTQP